MKYAIIISEMTEAELSAVSNWLDGRGAQVEPSTSMTGIAAKVATAFGAPAGASAQDPFAAPAGLSPAGPTPPPPPFAAPAGAPEVDARGIPHNAQFHADSKRQNANGSWARRKGVDKDACEAWEASFARTAPTPPAGQQPTPPAAPQPTTQEINAKFAPGLPPQGQTIPAPSAPAGAADPFAAPAAPPVAPPAPPVPAEDAPLPDVPYATWHALYTNLLTAGKMTPEAYTAIAERYGAIDDQMKFYNDPIARAKSHRDMELIAAS